MSGGTLLVNHGGKGANQAVAARRLGADVRMIGCVGDDSSGSAIRAALARQGIGVEGLVATESAATGTALIAVDEEGRNQIAVAPGANHRLTVEMARVHEDDIAWAQVLLWAAACVAVVAAGVGLGRVHGFSVSHRRCPFTSGAGLSQTPAMASARSVTSVKPANFALGRSARIASCTSAFTTRMAAAELGPPAPPALRK